MSKITQVQQAMLDTLREYTALDDMAMTVLFGRSWRRVWRALEEKGLVRYAPYAKEGRHYRAVKDGGLCRSCEEVES